MPYSSKAEFEHRRQKPPEEFIKSSFRTVPISHTPQGKTKRFPKGTEAIVGKLKKPVHGKRGRLRHYGTQSILVPK